MRQELQIVNSELRLHFWATWLEIEQSQTEPLCEPTSSIIRSIKTVGRIIRGRSKKRYFPTHFIRSSEMTEKWIIYEQVTLYLVRVKIFLNAHNPFWQQTVVMSDFGWKFRTRAFRYIQGLVGQDGEETHPLLELHLYEPAGSGKPARYRR